MSNKKSIEERCLKVIYTLTSGIFSRCLLDKFDFSGFFSNHYLALFLFIILVIDTCVNIFKLKQNQTKQILLLVLRILILIFTIAKGHNIWEKEHQKEQLAERHEEDQSDDFEEQLTSIQVDDLTVPYNLCIAILTVSLTFLNACL